MLSQEMEKKRIIRMLDNLFHSKGNRKKGVKGKMSPT